MKTHKQNSEGFRIVSILLLVFYVKNFYKYTYNNFEYYRAHHELCGYIFLYYWVLAIKDKLALGHCARGCALIRALL